MPRRNDTEGEPDKTRGYEWGVTWESRPLRKALALPRLDLTALCAPSCPPGKNREDPTLARTLLPGEDGLANLSPKAAPSLGVNTQAVPANRPVARAVVGNHWQGEGEQLKGNVDGTASSPSTPKHICAACRKHAQGGYRGPTETPGRSRVSRRFENCGGTGKRRLKGPERERDPRAGMGGSPTPPLGAISGHPVPRVPAAPRGPPQSLTPGPPETRAGSGTPSHPSPATCR
jgi:hypothetical protein